MKIHQRMSFMNLCLSFLYVLLCSGYVSCKWCTRIASEEHVHTIIEISQCQQSYKEPCSWWSIEKCTFYEMVTCHKERNHTVVQYKIVEECCPGYWLDTNTNVTCIQKSDNKPPVEEDEEVKLGINLVPLVELPPLNTDGNLTRKKSVRKKKVKERNISVQYYKSDDELLFGLSHGAYAGILCAFLFVSCVLILTIVHIVKRRHKITVTKQSTSIGNEMTEKMIQAPQV